MTILIKKYIITTNVVMVSINMNIPKIYNFKTQMVIPSDIRNITDKQVKSGKTQTFGCYHFKQIAVPISDSFIHILD